MFSLSKEEKIKISTVSLLCIGIKLDLFYWNKNRLKVQCAEENFWISGDEVK